MSLEDVYVNMDRKHVGARNELLATVWLLKQGYEVFRNVSQHGLIDLIAIKEDEVVFFDVKASGKGFGKTTARLTSEQIKIGVKCIQVSTDDQCIIDNIPHGKDDTTTTKCVNCGNPVIHRINSPRKFCSKSCSSKYHAKIYSKKPPPCRLKSKDEIRKTPE